VVRIRAWYTGFLLIATAVLAQAEETNLEKRVVEHTCPNGIHLLILERHFSPTVSIRMVFRTGGVDEVSGKTGLAHMFEHMMFKGTKTLGTKDYQTEAPILEQIDRLKQDLDREKSKGNQANQDRISKLLDTLNALQQKESPLVIENEVFHLYEKEGASQINAFTAPDITEYVLDIPSNKIELWAAMDSDRVKNPVFREFYTERDVVKEERRMRVDTNPEGALEENFLAAAFLAHPYHHPTIGWDSDLDHLSVADLQDFYRRHYTPDRLTIAVVGDVKADSIIEVVDKNFGSWAPSGVQEGEVITQEPPQAGERRILLETDAEPHLLIGFHIPTYPDPDHPVFYALARLLADGQSSRLYKSLVEKKELASGVAADEDTPGDRYPTLFVVSATPRYPHTPEEVERAILQELETVKKTPIETWELEKVRAAVDVGLLNTLQTNDGMAGTLAYDQGVFGDWRYLLRFQKVINTLTPADLQRVAQKYFTPTNRIVAVLVKKKP